MAKLTHIQQAGNQLMCVFDDGSNALAYPTPTGVWIVSGSSGPGPDPTGDLIDYYAADYPVTGDWESHASYSRGGTDYPLPYATPIKAPAAGTLVNYPNVDGAGLKSILIFDETYPRKIAASNTLMNGVYRETDAGSAPAAAYVAQHLDSQSPEGHYNQGDVIALSGNSAGPGATGDTHLHEHLLAGTTIDDRRMDFMKFV